MSYTSRNRAWWPSPDPVDHTRYGRATPAGKHDSTPEALNVVTQLRPNDLRAPIGTVAPVGLRSYEAELYRMRTQPHLYDDTDVSSAHDLAYLRNKRTGHLLADCHACHLTVSILSEHPMCPTCGGEV